MTLSPGRNDFHRIKCAESLKDPVTSFRLIRKLYMDLEILGHSRRRELVVWSKTQKWEKLKGWLRLKIGSWFSSKLQWGLNSLLLLAHALLYLKAILVWASVLQADATATWDEVQTLPWLAALQCAGSCDWQGAGIPGRANTRQGRQGAVSSRCPERAPVWHSGHNIMSKTPMPRLCLWDDVPLPEPGVEAAFPSGYPSRLTSHSHTGWWGIPITPASPKPPSLAAAAFLPLYPLPSLHLQRGHP